MRCERRSEEHRAGCSHHGGGRTPGDVLRAEGTRLGEPAVCGAALDRRTRKIWNRAEYGDDPNEIAEVSAKPAGAPTPEGPVLWLPRSARETGGRQHVGGVNDRLNDIAAREESSTAMDQIVDNVLNSTDVGGPAKVKAPVWRRGFSRQRGGT